MSGKCNHDQIELRIENFAKLDENEDGKVIEHVEIGHVEWALGARVESSESTDNVKHLGVYLKCNAGSRSNLWSCRASVRFTLVKMNSNDKNDGFSKSFDQCFNIKMNTLKVSKFKNWEEAICSDNRFVLAGAAVLKAEIKILSVSGIHMKILETFAQPRENLFDAQLVVEGKKVYVGKQYLAQYSKYFFDYFYGAGSSSTDESVQENLDHYEFIDLLNIIYPTHSEIDENNVGHLLELADRFKVPFVLEKCEKYLIGSNDFSMSQKLKFAETFKLSTLQEDCLRQLDSAQKVLALSKECKYSRLGQVSHSVILSKLINLMEQKEDSDRSLHRNNFFSVSVIRVKIDNFEDLWRVTEKPVGIDNRDWTLEASSSPSKPGGIRFVDVKLFCNNSSPSNLWSVQASVELKLVKDGSEADSFVKTVDFKFDANKNKLEVMFAPKWQVATCLESGFVADGTVILEARVHVTHIEGIHASKLLETFDEPRGELTDVELVVDGHSVHVGKQVLSHHSQVFYSHFFGKYRENASAQLDLNEVAYQEFVDLLNQIYPTQQSIDEHNLKHILKLADRYVVSMVLEKCEKFLIDSDDFSVFEKLLFAENYILSALQDSCLKTLKTSEKVLEMAENPDYSSLGDETRNLLNQILSESLRKPK